MAREKRSPSRLWFWALPVLANAYLVLLLIFGFIARLLPPWWAKQVAHVLLMPLLLAEFVVEPVLEPLEPMSLPVAFAVGLGAWEALAFVMGLVCYGAVLLVYAIVPADSAEGKQGNGSV